jgi:hypothetical protein
MWTLLFSILQNLQSIYYTLLYINWLGHLQKIINENKTKILNHAYQKLIQIPIDIACNCKKHVSSYVYI